MTDKSLPLTQKNAEQASKEIGELLDKEGANELEKKASSANSSAGEPLSMPDTIRPPICVGPGC